MESRQLGPTDLLAKMPCCKFTFVRFNLNLSFNQAAWRTPGRTAAGWAEKNRFASVVTWLQRFQCCMAELVEALKATTVKDRAKHSFQVERTDIVYKLLLLTTLGET